MAINDIQSGYSQIQLFLMSKGSLLPTDVRDKLVEVSSSPIAPIALCESAEVLYSAKSLYKASVKNFALELSLELFSFCLFNMWLGLHEGRGSGVIAALHRELGHEPVNGPWPAASEDPAPLEKFNFSAPSGE